MFFHILAAVARTFLRAEDDQVSTNNHKYTVRCWLVAGVWEHD